MTTSINKTAQQNLGLHWLQTIPSFWSLVFTAVTPLMILAPAAFTTNVVVQSTAIPFSQLAELVVPFAVIAFLYAVALSRYLNQRKLGIFETSWLMICFFVLGVFALGNGIHFSAQTLNHFVVTNKILGELREVAHLFNEKLTHLLWLPAILTFPLTLAGWELLEKKLLKLRVIDMLLSVIVGGWYGVLVGLAILEAQLAKVSLIWIAGLLGLGLLAAVTQKKLRTPMLIVHFIALFSMIGLITVWRLRYGGFPEPIDVIL